MPPIGFVSGEDIFMSTKQSGSRSAESLAAGEEMERPLVSRSEVAARSSDKVLHELQVYQIELEMQNECLRQAQVALEESRDRYAKLYEFAPVGYFTLTNTGLIAEVNLTGAMLLGEERSKLIRRCFAHFVVPQDQDRWERYFQNALRHGDKNNCELRLRCKGGAVFNVSLDSQAAAAGGSEPGLWITLTDITLQAQAMDTLRSSEERLLLAKNAANLGIFDRDIANDRFKWDERVIELLGVSTDDQPNNALFLSVVHPEDRAAAQAAIDKALEYPGTGKYFSEYRVISRSDDSVRNLVASGQAFFEDGRAVRLVGTVKDVTGQKKLEREVQIRRNEMELLIKQQVAAQTAAAIAHEMNQPLIAISAYSEAALLMLRGGNKSPEKLERALSGAMEQAHRAGNTLYELLDFLHQGDITLEPVNLNDIVREALAIAAESGYSGFKPAVELEHDLPLVMANRLQIQKVLVNLLHNSVEAMRDAGVSAAFISIRVQTRTGKSMALVTVSDSGPGIDAEMASRIFEPFLTTKPKGIGLGLAISRALIELHGGQLWADIEAAPGATFHFTLPFAS